MHVILIAIGLHTKPCNASLAFMACNWELLCNTDLINNPLAVREHQGDANDAMNPNGGHQIDIDHSTGCWNSTHLITRLTMITHWMHNSHQLPTT